MSGSNKSGSRRDAERGDGADDGVNVVVVGGTLCGEPMRHELDDGIVRVAFDLRAPSGDVPVTWFGPSAKTPSLRAGATVTVMGHVRRHFYRGPSGAVVSRTDVVAARVVAGRGKRRIVLIDAAIDRLDEAQGVARAAEQPNGARGAA